MFFHHVRILTKKYKVDGFNNVKILDTNLTFRSDLFLYATGEAYWAMSRDSLM
jgi:hypothetical protein